MQSMLGAYVDLRYYGNHDQVSSLKGRVISHDHVGIVVEDNSGQRQLFPWGSVQRLILPNPNNENS